MKDIGIYVINVSTHGPIFKSGRGHYYIAAKDKEQAIISLKKYFKKNNLFGSIYKPVRHLEQCKTFNKNGITYIYSDFFKIPLQFGEVVDAYKYLEDCTKLQDKEPYKFTPKKTAKGLKIHRINRPGIEYREKNVQGAYGRARSCTFNPDKPEMYEDCLDLHNIDGITFEGKPLNYENISDKTFEDF